MTTKKKTAKKKTSKKKVAKKSPAQRKNKKKITKSNPKAAGNITKVVDWDVVGDLCKLQCTGEEIASFLDISYDTLERHCKEDHDIKIGDYIKEKRQSGNVSLRRRQWLLAQSGNATMCIWLGKQYLGQKDKNDFSSEDGSMSNDGLSTEQRELLKKLDDESY